MFTALAVSPGPVGDAAEQFRTSPLALLTAAALLIGALYLFIRLLEWDQMNRETENQEDPFQE